MSYGRTVPRGGEYNRLADPSWKDPLDTSYSKARGGRWNAPGTVGLLYLNRDEQMARILALHKLAGQPFQIEDLDPDEQHDLVTVHLQDCELLDCVSAEGLTAVGLPESYPKDAAGQPVPHEDCRPVGAAARGDGHPGIACRSAATGAALSDEELAIFDTQAAQLVTQAGRLPFREWFEGTTATASGEAAAG